MKPVPVIYHHESGGWWADSPAIPGWSATAETLDELRELVEEGVHFALETDDVPVAHLLEMDVPPRVALVFDFVAGNTTVRTAPGAPLRAGDSADVPDSGLRLALTG